MESSNLESITKRESDKGFFKRNFKKIMLVAGVSAAAFIGSTFFSPFIKPIQKSTPNYTLDGEIEQKSFFSKEGFVDYAWEIEDLIGEVHLLNTGTKIEDTSMYDKLFKKWSASKIKDYLRDNLQDKLPQNKWLSDKIAYRSDEPYGDADPLLTKGFFFEFSERIFHKMGHKEKSCFQRYTEYNEEPFAEKNVIDSAIALMYLDPDLGYAFFSDYLRRHFGNQNLFEPSKDKWQTAGQMNLVGLIMKAEGKELEIKERYESNEEVAEIVRRETEGKDNNTLVEAIYKGLVKEFNQRFKNKKDYKQKSKLLDDYLTNGTVSLLYNNREISPEEFKKRINSKEDFLKQNQNLSKIIKEDMVTSLSSDYIASDDVESNYKLISGHIDEKVQKNELYTIHFDRIKFCMDYVLKKGDKEKAKEYLGLLEKNIHYSKEKKQFEMYDTLLKAEEEILNFNMQRKFDRLFPQIPVNTFILHYREVI